MKKYVWLLAIAAFAVAVFAMVGCRPAETPTPSPSPTAPTPTPDTKCPAIKSVVVRNVYEDAYERNVEKEDGSFTITLTFDEDVAGDWSCILDKDSWTVKVVNATRKASNFEEGVSAQVTNVEKKGKNKIAITATITETVNGTTFYGLLCSEDDATQYVKSLKLQDYEKPTVADTVTFKLKSTCKVYDQLGNTCCGLEGEACCAPVCEPVTIPSGCPLQ